MAAAVSVVESSMTASPQYNGRKCFDVSVSTNLVKPVALPNLSTLAIDNQEELVAGKVPCRTKSKRGLLFKTISAVKDRRVSVTDQGLLLVYTKADKGFVLDIAAADKLTVDKLHTDRKGMKLGQWHVHLAFDIGSLDLYLLGNCNHHWTAALERFFDGDGTTAAGTKVSATSNDVTTVSDTIKEKLEMATQTSSDVGLPAIGEACHALPIVESIVSTDPKTSSPEQLSNKSSRIPILSKKSRHLTTVISTPAIIEKEDTVSQKSVDKIEFKSEDVFKKVVRNSQTAAPSVDPPIMKKSATVAKLLGCPDSKLSFSPKNATLDCRERESISPEELFASTFKGTTVSRMTDAGSEAVLSSLGRQSLMDAFDQRSAWPFQNDERRNPIINASDVELPDAPDMPPPAATPKGQENRRHTCASTDPMGTSSRA